MFEAFVLKLVFQALLLAAIVTVKLPLMVLTACCTPLNVTSKGLLFLRAKLG